MKRSHIRDIGIVGWAMLAGCGGDSGTSPDPAITKPITIVSGAGASDTVNSKLAQALIIEVRVNGVLKKGVVIRFDALPSVAPLRRYEAPVLISSLTSDQYGTFIADSTDASGRARVLVQLGTVAGAAGVAITVPELGVKDTARFTVRPGNAARIVMSVRDTAVTVGATYSLGASAGDVFGNARTELPIFASLTPYTTIDAAGIVKAASAGRAVITIKSGAFVDTSRVSIVPDYTIVGVTQGTISTTKLDGTGLTRLTAVASSVMLPRWNPTGTRVVFYEGNPDSNAQLYTVDLAGVRTLVAVGAGPSTKFFPAFSADGQQLFFAGLPAGSSYSEIWRSQADGSGVTKLTSSGGQVVSTQPSPSPDGTKIVFNSGGIITTMDVASMTRKSLGVRGDFPKFSPDGTQILFLGQGLNFSTNLAVMNADGTNVRVSLTHVYDQYSGPSWSPDGTWIVVQDQYNNSLELVRASNFEILPLTKLNFTQASFKP
ncbi:MAG: hypothetical protein ABJE10_01360 [bacterium]